MAKLVHSCSEGILVPSSEELLEEGYWIKNFANWIPLQSSYILLSLFHFQLIQYGKNSYLLQVICISIRTEGFFNVNGILQKEKGSKEKQKAVAYLLFCSLAYLQAANGSAVVDSQ